MKLPVIVLTSALVLCGCSKNDQFTTPENATVILLCSSVLQTNGEVQIVHKLDEVIKGSIGPELLDESKIIKGLTQPYFEDLNVPSKYFILARPKINAPDIAHFIIKYQWSGIPVYDESILEHKDDIQFLQSEFERQLPSTGYPKFSVSDLKHAINEREKKAEPAI